MAKSGFATGFAGFLIGVVTGLGIAAGAALLITKSPMPFVDKVDRVTADVDPSKALAGGVDPNARLNQNATDRPAAVPAAGTVTAVTVGRTDAEKAAPVPSATVTYWVQVGAFSQKEDAETSAAQLAMQGIGAKLTAAGNLWRVRVGPFDDKNSAEEALDGLSTLGFQPVIAEQNAQ